MKKKLTSSGFTLVEVMIVAAVMGGLALVGMQMTKTMTKSTVKASFDSEKLLITNEINAILTDPAKCLATFGSTATPSSIYSKYFIKGNPSAPAQGYGSGNIEIESYTLGLPTPVEANVGVVTIAFINKNILKGATGTLVIPKTVRLFIEGAPGAITKCRAISSSTSEIWTRGDIASLYKDDIYYTQGSVGVGTATPKARLHVKDGGGSILSENNNTAGILGSLSVSGRNTSSGTPYLSQWTIYNMMDYGVGNSGMQFYEYYDNNNNNIFCEAGETCAVRMSIKPGGNVGIGTTNPLAHLHVESATPAYTTISNSNTSAGGAKWSWLSAGTTAPLGAGGMCFETGGICRMSLTPTLLTVANLTVGSTVSASSFQYTSDRRLKENIQTIFDSDEKIMSLRPVKFRWKKDKKDDYGFIAQDVKKVIPEITTTDAQNIMRVDYAKIIPFMVSTIQKQQKQIEKQQKQIEELERKLK